MATDEALTGAEPVRESPPADATSAAAEPQSPRVSRLPSLTGLRFLAALTVFIYHSWIPIPTLRLMADNRTEFRLYDWTTQLGGIGVSFFFVLSGFVLTWSARDTDTAPQFWRRRFVKIYPNYVVAWVFAWVVFASSATPARVAISNLLMVQVWWPSYSANYSVDPPSWSLAVEAIFYLCFPLLLAGFRRVNPRHLKYWIVGVIAGVWAAPAVSNAWFPKTPLIPGGQVSVSANWFSYVLPPVRMFDFALGILVALAVRHGRWRNIGMIPSFLLLAGAYWLTFHMPFLYGQRATLIIPIALLIAATATADIEGRFTLFRNRTMVWLGEISFAFYLLHYVMLYWLRKELGTKLYSTPATISMLVGVAVATVVLSWVLHSVVETPLMRRFSRSRRAKAA